MRLLIYTILQIALCLPMHLLADSGWMKFGKVEPALVKKSFYANDSTIQAEVIGDKSYSHFTFDINDGWGLRINRHKRIKIYNKHGYEHANVEILYYTPEDGDDEKVMGIKGYSYNLVNGKIVKTKLEKDAVFTQKINKYWSKKTFTLPDVKEGTVIEYVYDIASDYIKYLREWDYQSSIPIKRSEYNLTIPEFFNYKNFTQGYVPLTSVEESRMPEEFKYVSPNKPVGARNLDYTRIISSQSRRTEYVATNVPAFKEEPYMTSRKDYIAKVKFELASIQFPGEPFQNMLGTWEAMNKKFVESAYFGKPLDKSAFLNKIVEPLIAGQLDPLQKISTVYSHVKNRMTWNGFNSIYIDNSLKWAYDKKEGTVADINLLLTAMLRKAGINADPVLLSTRNNGFVRTFNPTSEQFNYVICRVVLDDKMMLLDATDPYLSISMIPEKCLNGKGWVVSKQNSGWVDLGTNKPRATKVNARLNLSEDGRISGTVQRIFEGYDARSKRKLYLNNSENDHLASIEEKLDADVEEYKAESVKDLDKPFVESIDLSLNSENDDLTDIYYIDPMIMMKMDDNPFKSKDRQYPVDFASPRERIFYMILNLPEGYGVEELPSPTAFVLPENGGKFTYNVSSNGNSIMVLSRLKIQRPLFTQLEYPSLREFYAMIVDKHAEQIVIKKL